MSAIGGGHSPRSIWPLVGDWFQGAIGKRRPQLDGLKLRTSSMQNAAQIAGATLRLRSGRSSLGTVHRTVPLVFGQPLLTPSGSERNYLSAANDPGAVWPVATSSIFSPASLLASA